jgi:aminoglycoside 6'-N-acetyltransferase I
VPSSGVVLVRRATPEDLQNVAPLRARLWPDGSLSEHAAEAADILAGRPRSTLPVVLFVAEDDEVLVGFVEVGLRSHADGCDPSLPCGFVEGWYVAPAHRRQGVGRRLMESAEAWARQEGCREIASDTWIDHEASQRAHAGLGFEVVDRCVNFRKTLGGTTARPHATATFYGSELARIHHDHFGLLARAAGRELLVRLSRAGIVSGTIVDLAAGSGILSRAATEAGFAVHGVDISEDMLRIARVEAPTARFFAGSLWSAELPRCVAVAAVGEAFNYAADPTAGLTALADRLAAAHESLAPGGILLFDVAGPERIGPQGSRSAFWTGDLRHLGLIERLDESRSQLTRTIHLFMPSATSFRHLEEAHVLRLYAPGDVEDLLTRTGFAWERLARYDSFDFPAGWHAYAAIKRPGPAPERPAAGSEYSSSSPCDCPGAPSGDGRDTRSRTHRRR